MSELSNVESLGKHNLVQVQVHTFTLKENMLRPFHGATIALLLA